LSLSKRINKLLIWEAPTATMKELEALTFEVEALEAKLEAVRGLAARWKTREYADWGGEEVQACRKDLEAALRGEEKPRAFDPVALIKSLSGEDLHALLKTTVLITDPLGQALIKKLCEEEAEKK